MNKNWNAAGSPVIVGEPEVRGPQTDEPGSDEFSRFESLTQTLVGVPKEEIDEERRRDD